MGRQNMGRPRTVPRPTPGLRVGRLTVVEKDTSDDSMWVCRCDCGNLVTIKESSLIRKSPPPVKSCGCLRLEQLRRILTADRFDGTRISRLKSRKPASNNKTGHSGVWYDAKHGWYTSYIYLRGKKKHLGVFYDYNLAVAEREKAEEEYFGPIIKAFDAQNS